MARTKTHVIQKMARTIMHVPLRFVPDTLIYEETEALRESLKFVERFLPLISKHTATYASSRLTRVMSYKHVD